MNTLCEIKSQTAVLHTKYGPQDKMPSNIQNTVLHTKCRPSYKIPSYTPNAVLDTRYRSTNRCGSTAARLRAPTMSMWEGPMRATTSRRLPTHALLDPEIGNLLPNNRRQRRTCCALCHILYPVSAARTRIFRMDSNSTSFSPHST